MLKPGSKRSQRDAAQFAIAVFDSWDALLGFLKKGRIGAKYLGCGPLRAYGRSAVELEVWAAKRDDRVGLHESAGAIACTSGPVRHQAFLDS
jgi:hypothetical protein